MRRRRNSWLILAVLLVLGLLGRLLAPDSPSDFGSAGECGEKFAFGRPLVQGEGENATLLCRKGYAVLHDPDLRVSLYAAERLTNTDADGSVPRQDDFEPDPDLPAGERAELSDYRGSGFDRGHLAPAADFSDDPTEMDESFLLSNMVPQNGPMNSGIWSGLESATRACAKSVGEIFIYTGPVFEGGVKRTVGRNRVAVPTGLYKVVVEPKSGQARTFLMPNRALQRTSDFGRYEVPVTRIEQLTGLTFFPEGRIDKTRSGAFCASSFGS
ncbi:DNA/RNA non-specific endonuclease [Deinococcus peraridilitoris]|uniref:Endonuclease n=1 Tax=Deinococcus peraridilitoris (strain DSM 19664 / LMG 22246 / CIP 109416 / KR-200) TaxID=937777 RepID=L0A6P9_DEIPD|nr:DNA/RNA non-specific endonuclease [Deinococcus peraridilitoris]AFZ68867.1 DNA/RNA endonuclease G, NUC1 [Deinococcus peraridilitoris DSM 19664]